MRTARIICVILAVCLICALCAGCGEKAPEGLTIMGKKSDLEKDYMVNIFEHYEKSTGKKIIRIPVEDSQYETRSAELFAKGEGPDIFLHFHNADLARFDVEEDFLYLNDQPWVSDITDSAWAYCQDSEGNLLGLPFWESSVSGCYYNKTILDSLGLNPATTQAEFDMLCQALCEVGRTPICWPADGCSWMAQFGLDPIFADDQSKLDGINSGTLKYADIPEVTDMVSWLAAAAEKGWFGSDFMNTGWSDISPALASGSAVMTFIWDTWFYTDFTPEKYTLDDFALMPIFMNTAPSGTYEGGNLNMMMVNKNSDRLDEALDFLEFCATPENYNVAFEGISTVSCFKGQTTNIQSPMVTDAAASIAANERVSTAASRILGYSAEDMMTTLNSLFTGKLDVPGCVKAMDDHRLDEISSRYPGSSVENNKP